jgi:hypothetical protein
MRKVGKKRNTLQNILQRFAGPRIHAADFPLTMSRLTAESNTGVSSARGRAGSLGGWLAGWLVTVRVLLIIVDVFLTEVCGAQDTLGTWRAAAARVLLIIRAEDTHCGFSADREPAYSRIRHGCILGPV